MKTGKVMKIGDRVRVITKIFDGYPVKDRDSIQSGKTGVIVNTIMDTNFDVEVQLDNWNPVSYSRKFYKYSHLEPIGPTMIDPEFSLDEIHRAKDLIDGI